MKEKIKAKIAKILGREEEEGKEPKGYEKEEAGEREDWLERED